MSACFSFFLYTSKWMECEKWFRMDREKNDKSQNMHVERKRKRWNFLVRLRLISLTSWCYLLFLAFIYTINKTIWNANFIVPTVFIQYFAFHLSSRSVQNMSTRLTSFDHNEKLSWKGGKKFLHIYKIFISKPIFLWIIDL